MLRNYWQFVAPQGSGYQIKEPRRACAKYTVNTEPQWSVRGRFFEQNGKLSQIFDLRVLEGNKLNFEMSFSVLLTINKNK